MKQARITVSDGFHCYPVGTLVVTDYDEPGHTGSYVCYNVETFQCQFEDVSVGPDMASQYVPANQLEFVTQ
jgi:hypothetical protein